MRIKRWKAPIAVSALALTVVLTVAACSSSTNDSAALAGPKNHTLNLSFLQDPGQPPDPDVFYGSQGLLLTTNIYEGLLTFKAGTATPTLAPALATSWTASKDNKVFTFKLRQGVTFHDGTPFTSDAVKASFDRRLAVNQGPAYMVQGIQSITTQGKYAVTVTLTDSNSVFLTNLASPYGPKIESPTALAAHAGKDNDQTYLETHDIGTGPYELTAAAVGSRYALKAYPNYWGKKPYFTTVNIPVVSDASSQQLQFDNGSLAAILHDVPSSAVKSYTANSKVSTYNLPTEVSDYLYVNPHVPAFATTAVRRALQGAIDIPGLVKGAYFDRGTAAKQIYPLNITSTQYAAQKIKYDPSKLKSEVAGLPASDRSITIGYDSSSPDNQQVATLLGIQLTALGLVAKVQSYPTSQIFGWVGNQNNAPAMLVNTGFPDGPSPYDWEHINFDADGGVNLLGCSSHSATALIAQGLVTGSNTTYSQAAEAASETGCWMNLVDVSDFVVAQPWLKGVSQAHIVANPNTLMLADLHE
jgi:peptide/nickel transport system substrate-binding protein